jgi:hypothetical protein
LPRPFVNVDGLSRDGSIDGIPADATPEQLRAEIAKRVALLRDKGYVDLDALPAPSSDITERDITSGDVADDSKDK